MSVLTKEEEVLVSQAEAAGPGSRNLAALVRRLESRVRELESDNAHRAYSLGIILRQATENIDPPYALFRLKGIAHEAREGLAVPSSALSNTTPKAPDSEAPKAAEVRVVVSGLAPLTPDDIAPAEAVPKASEWRDAGDGLHRLQSPIVLTDPAPTPESRVSRCFCGLPLNHRSICAPKESTDE